jgi:uroporphyrinogen-III synthase
MIKEMTISQPLQNRVIALAEGRQLEDLARMLEKEGATTLRYPMLSILDQPDAQHVGNWIRELIAGRFNLVILLTGEGLRRLLGFVDRENLRDPFIAALGRTRIVTRGPKPVQALKEIGLLPTQVAQAPTTDGVITTLRSENLQGTRIGVQLYSESNPPLTNFLVSAGAAVCPVSPYAYAPLSDSARVTELIEKMDEGQVDALVFTSSPQIDRLFEVAVERKVEEALFRGLQRVKVAAVGPIVRQNLIEKNVRVDIMPEQGFQMKNLVLHIKRAFAR